MVIISIIAFSILAGPFISSAYLSNRNRKNLIQALKKHSHSASQNLNKFDLCRNTVIGLDEVSQILYFYRRSSDREFFTHFPIREIKSCELIKKFQKFQMGRQTDTSITYVGIKVAFRSRSEEILDLFESDADGLIGDDLIFAKKWITYLNSANSGVLN